jgi:hypothetical protein
MYFKNISKMKKVAGLAVVIMILISASAQATISFVKLQAGSVNASQNLSLNHAVSNKRVQGFRMPFVTGVSHVVDLTGAFLDVCDRVEICNSSGTVRRTLRGTSLNKFKSNNEGHVKFTVNASDLPAVDGDFILKVRYAVELNGFDQLDCKVAARGVINSIQWVGTTLPTFSTHSSGAGEVSTLTVGRVYTLQFNGTGFSNSVQLFDGLRTALFNTSSLPFTSTDLTVNSTGTIMTLTVRPSGTVTILTDLQSFTSNSTNLLFVFGGVGNIPGGWGPYLVYDYNNLLSNAGALTDLKQIRVEIPPSGVPELVISKVLNKFVTTSSQGGSFSDADLSSYQLCNTATTTNVKTTVIPNLSIQISNTSNMAAPATTLRVFSPQNVLLATINVPAIDRNSFAEVQYVRPQSTVCGQGTMLLPTNRTTNIQANRGTCFVCNASTSNNLPLWTDLGLILELTPVPSELNTNNNKMVIQ